MALPKIKPAAKRRILYKDFPSSMKMNPVTNDISVITDEKAVAEAMRNLIMTNRGERLFQPNLGGNVQRFLFENNSNPAILKLLKEMITDTIVRSEGKRVELIDVEVYGDVDSHGIEVKILYYIRNSEEVQVVNILLERTK